VVSGGHTAMTPHDLAAARAAGLSYTTHLFNAMAPFGHRMPGPIGAVLADDTLVAGLICDGIHVDPVAVRMAWHALGPGRLSLVSDASPALGMPHGSMELAGFEIVHDESGVRTVDGVLAGSALALDQAVRHLVAFSGCDLADALATVTTTPADLLGLTDRGRLEPGRRADLTILDHDGTLVATVVAGHLAHDAR
jgi:N-acetylglucosamine-6-phosphate deacetylase